ncbi:MAG: CapA family protein [Ruminococcaceae bacterium]|nr:CapA family protein [Oscillospiraceae bacterium]
MKFLTVGLTLLLVTLLLLAYRLPDILQPSKPNVSVQDTRPTETNPSDPSNPTQPSDPSAPTQPSDPSEPTQPSVPADDRFLLSFAGDCTFGDNLFAEPGTGYFTQVVGDRYDYPFANVKSYFAADDLTFVNLECALTTYDPTDEELVSWGLDEKEFRFRGDPAYAQILAQGSVEFASLANNHSLDFAEGGLNETMSALEGVGVNYADRGKTCMITTESGLVVGIYAHNSWVTAEGMTSNIRKLRQQGAELVIVSLHWGEERHYAPSEQQQTLGHLAIDSGANIVFGHHPHVLQPMELYNGGLILYSMGNFSFGGNRNPVDKDTAIVQQEIIRDAEGNISLGDTILIPCRVSSVSNKNDYQPTPYAVDDPGYDRVLSKLDGSYAKDWLEKQQASQQPSEPTEPTMP